MRALFICLTDYQILNSINIKLHLLKNDDADILFFDNKEGNKDLAKRLKKSGVFKNVYLHQYTNVYGLREYMKSKLKEKSFFIALKNSLKDLLYIIKCKVNGLKYKINGKLYDNVEIDFGCYDKVFGIPTKDVVGDTMKIVLDKNSRAEINFIEDGTSTYWEKSIKSDIPYKNIYLYEPELANYYDQLKQIIKVIPKVNSDDKCFKEILNEVFGFENIVEDYSNKVIFFDQNWDPMPEYLKDLNGIKKIVLNNAYKKHLKESALYDKKMQLFRILSELMEGKKEVIVKLHPRSDAKFVADYKKSKCTIADNINLPWEVIENNYKFYNNIWVTVSSTALCSLKTVFENKDEDVKLIFLHRLVYGNDGKYKDDTVFFERFRSKYENNVYIPQNVDEYIKVLNLEK